MGFGVLDAGPEFLQSEGFAVGLEGPSSSSGMGAAG